MKAEETNLLKFMNGPKQFIIPIYQRPYSWTLTQCKQLWEDIVRSGRNKNISSHFLGSIVYIEKGLYQISTIPQLLLIDGQQRLTTISLILSVLSKKLEEHPVGEMNSEKLKNYFLVNNNEEGDKRFKLVLTKSDKETLFRIIDHKDLTDGSERIIENYKYFVDQISKSNIEEILNGLNKLIIIDVSLDRERDNPQLIFESLNSTGLALTQSDLIRNYVLMGLEKQEQDVIYNDYWLPMEKNFGYSGYSLLFDKFMRDYLTIKTGQIPNIDEVYTAFKTYAQKYHHVKEFIGDIYKYSEYFVNIALEKELDEQIKSIFSDINTLKVDVSYPFLLEVYRDYTEKKISREEFIQILELIESYVFRRAICGVPTNSLNKTFANLYKEIKKESYLESFKAALLLKESYRRFPKDEEFKDQLIIKDVYNFRNRNYLLKKLENYERKELVNVESYTIEHIMPQNENLSSEWKQELGENWREVHNKYLHTLGNLTLTGYNPELSDRPFREKRDMKGGFKDSPIRLNRYLSEIDHWNEEEIIKRAKALSDLAVKIWIYPTLDDETLEKYKSYRKKGPETIYTIDDHHYLAEGNPMRLIFEELRKRIKNLDSSVREEILKLYIAYKTITNFVDIIPLKSKLRLSLNIQFDEINDPKGLCKDVTNKGRWGNGNVEVDISKFEDLDYAMFLIKQAFDKISEEKA
ncbi:MAG: DUF262 and DUF1524 domain-containing protein [Nitrososphaeria archaeon]